MQARNLFHASVAMYDAWAAYDSVSKGFLYQEKHVSTDVIAARREAISYAAYRILTERYTLSRGASTTLPLLDAQMNALGFDRNNHSLDTSTPAGVGNRVAALVSAHFLNDGARQSERYADLPLEQGGYVYANAPLDTGVPGAVVNDINRWQRLFVADALDQSGMPIDPLQKFVGAQWLGVLPFSLVRAGVGRPWIDPGPQPLLGGEGDVQFRDEIVEVLRYSRGLDPENGQIVDISPGAMGNNSLGANDGSGHPLNPATGQPYASNHVKRGDFARILAEFWADGPNSETPPGHWNAIANSVSDSPELIKKIAGVGPVVDDLEWDVKLYFALNAAVHDAGCAAWSLKRYYDGGRPISAIRYMGGLGQSSNPQGASYHPNGLPLIPGLIELVTAETASVGARHAGMPVGTIAVFSWPGQPEDPATQFGGARWIRAVDWLPYQRDTFVTPAFPGYVSGHSTFSRSAAEVLAAITGSSFFPGGMGVFTAYEGKFLSFEKGPSEDVQLHWATYFDAADQAGLSRLWGGIHSSTDDLTGRLVGAQCGKSVWVLAQRYFAPFAPETTLVKGSPVPGEKTGARYGMGSVPQVSPKTGSIISGRKRVAAVFGLDGAVMLKEGDEAPGLPGSKIKKIAVVSGDAAVVVLHPGMGGVAAKNKTLLLTGLSSYLPRVALQLGFTGTNLPGSTIKSLRSIDGNGRDIFFTGSLGGGGVHPAKADAVGAVLESGEVNVLVRKGQVVNGKEVAVIGTLVASKGTLAEGRWRINDSTLGVRLTFKDKHQALFAVPSDAKGPDEWTLLAKSGDVVDGPIANATVGSFSLPAFGPQSWASAVNLATGPGGVSKFNSRVILNRLTPDGAWKILAQTSGVARDYDGLPLANTSFKSFRDPVSGANGKAAFIATLAGLAVKRGTATGIWYAADGETVKLLARTGDDAVGGGTWASFASLILPNGSHAGPVFSGKLLRSKVAGIGMHNDTGLWAVESSGRLQLLLRTGQKLFAAEADRIVRSFVALTAAPSSLGAASGHHEDGRVATLVTFTDGHQAIVNFRVP